MELTKIEMEVFSEICANGAQIPLQIAIETRPGEMKQVYFALENLSHARNFGKKTYY